MKRFPRILSLLLVLCMILSLVPTVVFAEESEATEGHFSDVPAGEWYYEYVEAAYEAGLVDGFKDGTFLPQKPLTRAEAATLLYRMEGSPEVEGAASFTDLPNEWYRDAIAWAEANNVAAGYPDGTFRPDEAVTREQFVTMVWRLEGKPEATTELEGFADTEAVQEYARTAFAWAVENGIINGLTSYQWEGVRLAPQNSIKRCEAAKILVVYTDSGDYTYILHSNDVHGAVEGYAYMAALKAELEAAGANVILADAGDFSQGTTYVSVSKGATAVELMNLTGYDVVGLGNHEFDYGYPQLKENMEKAEFSVLCSDVLDENGDPIFDAYTIIEKDGLKVGFFGLETPETQTKANPALIQGLTFLTDSTETTIWENAQEQVDALKAEGADIVICLSHLGVDESSEPYRSYDLYEKVTGIDFIIDAHSHTVMTEGTNGEPIQSTGTKFANIGVIMIDNKTKKIVDNDLLAIASEEVPDGYSSKDKRVAEAAQAIIDEINELYGAVFATSEVTLNGAKDPGNRTQETNNGDLITDAMVWCLTEQYPGSITQVPAENIVAITNGGGIRAAINPGDVTKNDILTVLPFGNTVAVVYVTGAELLEALEASTYCTPVSVGGFPQVSGMKFTIDTTKEYDKNEETYPGSTYYGPASIKRVTINEINGKPFDPKATYAVITNNFCAGGGDTYYAFASASSQFDTGYTLDAVVVDYITEKLNGVITAEQYGDTQGRITVIESVEEWDGKIIIGGLDAGLWTTKYGNIYTNASAKNVFTDLGFNYGDIITVKFLDQELDLPLVSNFSDVDSGTAALFVAKEGDQPSGYAYLAINMGNFTDTYGIATKKTDEDGNWYWEAKEGVTFPIEVTFELKEAGGYMAEYLLHQLSRTNNREDYPELTDEQFANFREVTTTGMGAGKLYRSSSPINPELGRNAIADAAAEKAGIKTFVNLANNQTDAEAYEGYADTYYSKQNVVFLNLGVDFSEQSFKDGLATGFRYMIDHEGPYLVHCTEGKDRAGYVSALLECLMGATYDEVVADYMTTYINYYKVELGSEQYNAIAESNIIKSLSRAFGVEDLSAADLQAGAEAYLKEIGLTDEEIAALKANLGGTADENVVNFEFLVTSDIHGKIFASDYSSGYAASGTYRQGLTRIATYIKEQKAIYGDNVYTVDMGDSIQGEPLSYYYAFNADKLGEVDPTIRAFRTIGYDMWLLGNHEFNYGIDILTRQIAEAVAPATETENQLVVVDANYLDADTNNSETKSWDCVENIVPYVIKDFDGVKVAIIGLSTPNIPNWDGPANWKGFYFESIYATYKHYEAEMLEKADMIVVMAHCGLNSEMADASYDGIRYLVEHTNTIDFAFSGHAHGTMVNDILNSDGEVVKVLQPGTKAALISRVTVSYDKTTGEYTLDTKNEDMKNYALDQDTVDMLQPYETYVWENYMLVKIGEAGDNFTASGLGTGPSAFVDLVNKVQLWGAYDSTGLNTPDDPSDDTMAMLSITAPLTSGSNANVISKGDIMLGDLFALYRYENWFYQLTMTGKEVRTWLEYSASKVNYNESTGNVSVMGGLTYYDVIGGEDFSYVIDPTKPEGSRIVSMTYKGTEVADDFEFTVVMNNYRFTGGGNYVKYCNEHGCDLSDLESRIIYSTQYDMIQGEDLGQARALLQAYIQQEGVIQPEITSTWSIQPNYTASGDDDTYVAIYCNAKGKTMTTATTTYTNPSSGVTKEQIVSADATLSGDKLSTAATDVALFKMVTVDGVTTFQTADGKWLHSDGTNVTYEDTFNENCEFVLDEVEGGYYIRLANYLYNGTKPQYLEFYANVFTCYGMGYDPSIYIFNFYEVG